MTSPNFEASKLTPLDDRLDAALAKYAAVEPRAGLEARILANLRAQQQTEKSLNWWRWTAAITAALLILTTLIWRTEQHGPQDAVRVANSPEKKQQQVVTNTVVGSSTHTIFKKTAVRRRKHSPTAAVAQANAKLEQFPSPRPLTEQEKLLAEYVSQFQDEAVLVARARAEVLRQDLKQMQRGTAVDDANLEKSK